MDTGNKWITTDGSPSPPVKELIKFFTQKRVDKQAEDDSSVDVLAGGSGNVDESVLPSSTFRYNVFKPTKWSYGREAEMEQLHKIIQRSKDSKKNLAVVSQVSEEHTWGGVGKSEFVRMYLHEHQNAYNHISWMDATDASSLRNDFQKLVSLLDPEEDLKFQQSLSGKDSGYWNRDEDLAKKVYGFLQGNKQCLLVFDNVESLDIVDFLPPEEQRGKPMVLIITSQVLSWSQEPMLISPFDPLQGGLFLAQLAGCNAPDFTSISTICDGCPLLLRIISPLVAHLGKQLEIDQGENQLELFLESFKTALERYLSSKCPDSSSTANTTLAVILRMCFQQLIAQTKENCSEVIEYLKYFAFFPPIIHKQVVQYLLSCEDVSVPNRSPEVLVQAHLISDLGSHYEIHPQIQCHLLSIIESESVLSSNAASENNNDIKNENNQQSAVNVILEDIICRYKLGFEKFLSNNSYSFPVYNEFLRTGRRIATHLQPKLKENPKFWGSCRLIAKCLANVDFTESYKIFEEILNFRVENMPEEKPRKSPKSPRKISSLNTKLSRGKLMLKSVLKHPDTSLPERLATLQVLGHVLNMLGKYERAILLFQEASKLQLKVWGPHHLEHLITSNTIGSILLDLEDYDQALDIFLETYHAFEGQYGMEHPFSVTVQSNIGIVFHRQKDHAKALEIYQSVCSIQERLFGKNHPTTLRTRNNIAVILDIQGKHEEAQVNFTEIMQEQLENLGKFHADTLSSGHNIASVLDSQGRLEDAEKIYTDVYENRARVLGHNHPDTLSTKHNLALVLDKQGRYSQALPLYMQVLKQRQHVFGETHPDTLNTHYNMAIALESSQNYLEALEAYVRVHEALKSVHGPEHRVVFYVLHNMAHVHEQLGNTNEAYSLYHTIHSNQSRIFGPQDPDTLHTLQDIAGLQESQGRLLQALELYLQVYECRLRQDGEDHPDTVKPLRKMAAIIVRLPEGKDNEDLRAKKAKVIPYILGHNMCTEEVGKKIACVPPESLLEHYKSEYEVFKRGLGPVHSQTLAALFNIGLVFGAMDKLNEAATIFDQVLDNMKDILGKDSSETLTTTYHLAVILNKQGKFSEALSLFSQVHVARKTILGKGHPRTLVLREKVRMLRDVAKNETTV